MSQSDPSAAVAGQEPLARALFDALHSQTHDRIGITRASYGPGEQAAREPGPRGEELIPARHVALRRKHSPQNRDTLEAGLLEDRHDLLRWQTVVVEEAVAETCPVDGLREGEVAHERPARVGVMQVVAVVEHVG